MKGGDQKLRAASVPRWKRVADISIVLLFSPLWVPMAVLAACVIKCVSKGPLIYKQERIGRGGVRFLCFKFRTMRCGADTRVHELHVKQLIAAGAPLVKLDARSDRRLIPLGWLIRALGLDELPQIANVIRGDMSLVGPRPCTVQEFEHYRPDQLERFSGLPGLTGLWQVSGKNRTSFDEMVALDIRYLRNVSVLLDLGIMLRTGAILGQQFWEAWRGGGEVRETAAEISAVGTPRAGVE